jgi:hypothetical protein
MWHVFFFFQISQYCFILLTSFKIFLNSNMFTRFKNQSTLTRYISLYNKALVKGLTSSPWFCLPSLSWTLLVNLVSFLLSEVNTNVYFCFLHTCNMPNILLLKNNAVTKYPVGPKSKCFYNCNKYWTVLYRCYITFCTNIRSMLFTEAMAND